MKVRSNDLFWHSVTSLTSVIEKIFIIFHIIGVGIMKNRKNCSEVERCDKKAHPNEHNSEGAIGFEHNYIEDNEKPS